MDETHAEQDLFQLGRRYFEDFLEEFASYGIQAAPGMELRRGKGLLCYYDTKDGNIYLSLPDFSAPEGKLHWLFLRSLLSCRSNEEFLRLCRLLIPHSIAHELAHHYRSRCGVFGSDLWREEQIANQLSMAVVKRRYSPKEREELCALLERAISGLAEKLGIQGEAADAYHDVWRSLNIEGRIGDRTLDYMELARRLFGTDPGDMLESSGQMSEPVRHRLEHRGDVIDGINEEYASDFVRYLYYQLGWARLDLSSRENQYIDGFAREYLNLGPPQLPPVPEGETMDERQVAVLFSAYRESAPHSDAAGRYFYKRYRSALLEVLSCAEDDAPSQVERLKKEAVFILQSWGGDSDEPDLLSYLSHLAPPQLADLFPNRIAGRAEPVVASPELLPTETDQRLWKHAVRGESDESAANTLSRMALMDQTAIFRSLPAEAMIEAAHCLHRVRLGHGDTIIWEGERNRDVFLLVRGKLNVLARKRGLEKLLGTVGPGEVVGEMSFFTLEPRNARVRAAEPSECLVLRDLDLHLLSFKYPVVLMQMAGTLARRLAEMNRNAARRNTSFFVPEK